MAAKDPDGFADTELAPWRASLSEADWARLSARQKTFRDDPAARHRVASRHKQIVRAFAGSDLSNTEIGEQLRAVDQTLAATEKRTGKPATAKEFTDIVEINKHRWQLAQEDIRVTGTSEVLHQFPMAPLLVG
jgi:hypothetical protein